VAAGFTQAELGAQVGVSESAVQKWENGQSKIAPVRRRPLARVLGLTLPAVDRLATGAQPAWWAVNGPGVEEWTIMVWYLPWRPCTAITGPFALAAPLL